MHLFVAEMKKKKKKEKETGKADMVPCGAWSFVPGDHLS